MSAATMTEAEQERAERARIDRMADIKRSYARRPGAPPEPARVSPSSPRPAASDDAASQANPAAKPGSMTERILAMCKKLADKAGNLDRRVLCRELGAVDTRSRDSVTSLICSLRRAGRFPYTFTDPKAGAKLGGKAATKPAKKAATKPGKKAEASAARVATSEQGPVPVAPPPEVDYARLGRVAADVIWIFEALSPEERAFALALVQNRFA